MVRDFSEMNTAFLALVYYVSAGHSQEYLMNGHGSQTASLFFIIMKKPQLGQKKIKYFRKLLSLITCSS